MDLGIRGKVALVTGASAGLGYAVARTLAGEGVKVAINSRSKARLEKAASEIEAATGFCPFVIEGDISQDETPEKVVEAVRDNLGEVDILVSNVGGPPTGFFLELEKKVWRSSADLILYSAIELTRAVLPGMEKRQWGRIIYITSVAVKQPIDNLIISNAFRAGLTGFAKTISNQFSARGITINTVMPGYTKTERLKGLAAKEAEVSGKSEAEIYAQWAEKTASARLAQPEELGALVTFLASARAAYITGTAIPVDGGYIKALM